MNITNFDYSPQPKYKFRKFGIHPLTDEGFNQYTDKDSYTHKFLKSLSPQRVDKIFNFETLKSNRLVCYVPNENSQPLIEDQKVNEDEQVEMPKIISKTTNKNKPLRIRKKTDILTNENENSKSPIFNRQSSDLFTNTIIHSNFSKSKNYYNLSPIKNYKINRKSGNIKEELSQSKYEENYLQKMDNLKKSLNGFNIKPKKKNSHSIVNTSIKQAESQQNYYSPRFKLMNDKISKVIYHQDPTIENDKLKDILKSVWSYEKTSKFPNISLLYNQNKIRNASLYLSGNKIMGEKYNPLNFYHGSAKSTVRRNQYGALFQH